jgi:hypothetical protein
MSFARIAELNKIDNALMIKNDRMGRNARPRLNVVKKNITGVDEELLKEYQQIKPQTFEYTDEKTGETKYRKYLLPDASPELEADQQFASEDDLKRVLDNIEELKEDILNRINQANAIAEQSKKEIDEIREDINNVSVKTYPNMSNSQLRDKRNEFLREKQVAERDLREIQKQITQLEKQYYDIDIIKQNTREEWTQYNTETSAIKKRNLDKVNMFRDELNFLNKGAFSTAQAPNESEMEYLQRLQDNAQILAPEDELTDAKFMTISRFREKMRELVKDPVLIEQVINSLDGNSPDNVDNKALLLKSWDLLKNKFVSVYGINNKRLKVDDILAFFDAYLNGDVTQMQDENPAPSAEETPSKSASASMKLPSAVRSAIASESFGKTDVLGGLQIVPIPTDDTLQIINNQTRKSVYLRTLSDDPELYLLYSFTGEDGTYKQFFDDKIPSDRKKPNQPSKSSVIIERETGITPLQLNNVFDVNSKNINVSNACKKMKSKYNIRAISIRENSLRVTQKPYALARNEPRDKIEYGMGMKGENLPQYVPFGDVNILLKKLFYDNVLSVRNKQMKSVAGLPVAKVSEQMVKIITNMVEGIHPTYAEINSLASPERQLYDRLIRIANLNKTVVHQGDKSVAELKKRLSLIEGELEMGNDNYALMQEIHTILNSLHQLKAITKGQKDKYIQQFNK